MGKKKTGLLILFSVVVLDLIGFGVVIPILPFFAETYGANATVLGLLLTSFAAMQFLFSPVWGKLSDRIGRRKVLILTMVGSVVGLLILGSAQSLTILFVGRIVSGIFSANISVATAYVTDITTNENRAQGMGLIGAAFGVGFILGPALGGFLSEYGYPVPIFTAAGLGVLNVIYATIRLGESHPPVTRTKTRLPMMAAIRSPYIQKICLINLLYTLGINQLESVFAFFMMDRFHYDAKDVAYILVFMALIMVAIQGGLIKKLAARFGEKNLLLMGVVFLACAFLTIPLSHQVAVLLIPLAVSALGRGISQPSTLSLVSKGASEELRGAVMGIYQSSASLGRVLGPLAAGALYDRAQAYPFFLAAGLLVIVFAMGMTLKVPRSHEETVAKFEPAEADASC